MQTTESSSSESALTTQPSSPTPSLSYHSNDCRITFHDEINYQGDRLDIFYPNGVSNLPMNEKSAQTFGRCCWKIYR